MSSYKDRILMLHTGTSAVVDDITEYTGFSNMLVRNFQPGYLEGDYQTRDFATGIEGAQAEELYNKHTRTQFELEGFTSGTAGTAPVYDPILKACGLAATISAGNSVSYSPLPIRSAYPDCVFQHRNGLMSQIVEGARGAMSFNAEVNRKPMFSFDMMGKYRGPDAAVAVAPPDHTDWNAALECSPANMKKFTVGGTDLCLQSFSFSDGRQAARGRFMNCDETYIAPYRFTGRIAVKFPDPGSKDIIAMSHAETTEPLIWELGADAGSGLRIVASQCQLKYAGETNIDGELGANIDLVFQADQGADDLAIIFK